MKESVLLQSLAEEVKSIKATLDEAKEAGQAINEAQTEFIVIDPLLRRLGYSPLEISKRSRDGVANNFPDYTILGNKPQKWFLEAKRLDLPLQDGEAAQAVNYANNQGAEWAVLTNGRKWCIYSAHLQKPLPEKRVLQIDDLFADERALDVLLLLSKPAILANELQEAWLMNQLTKIVTQQLAHPGSEVRRLLRDLGAEATKHNISEEMVNRALLFAMSSASGAADQDAVSPPSKNGGTKAIRKPAQTDPGGQDGTFHTLGKLAADITLSSFRRPTAIVLGGGPSESVKTWADAAQKIVEYVGSVKALPALPYKGGGHGKNCFLNTSPTHSGDKPMLGYRVASVGTEKVYVDTNRSTLNLCGCLLALLSDAGVAVDQVELCVGPSYKGASRQTTEVP